MDEKIKIVTIEYIVEREREREMRQSLFADCVLKKSGVLNYNYEGN